MAMQAYGAAVAVVEWMRPGGSAFLLLRRTSRPADPWSGHWAFPGGRAEPSDLSPLHTCLRECEEECGLRLHANQLVSRLPPAWAGRHAGRHTPVQPFHFRIQECPPLVLQPEEMDLFYWLPRADFAYAANHAELVPPGMDKAYPGYGLPNGYLWGFTYQVLYNLVKPLQGPRPATAYA